MTEEKKSLKQKLANSLLVKCIKNKWVKSIIIIAALLLAAFGIINKFFNLKIPEDHIVEETIEKVIEGNTGIDIDLTPHSEEAKG